MEDCIVYLVWQLRQAGFEIRFTWPNLLYIAWRHHEGEYLTKKNPIIQAMMPDKPTPQDLAQKGGSQKKKSGASASAASQIPGAHTKAVAFNTDIELITNRGPSMAPVRQAIDYEPPASFIQHMERPGPGRNVNQGFGKSFGEGATPSPASLGLGQGQGQGQGVRFQTGAKGNVLADLWTF